MCPLEDQFIENYEGLSMISRGTMVSQQTPSTGNLQIIILQKHLEHINYFSKMSDKVLWLGITTALLSSICLPYVITPQSSKFSKE